ncbi:MAG: hypothetical protein WD041_03320, partial [Nitriliruptoraceae bacterium]
FADMEFVHVRAGSLLNRVADGGLPPFRWTINIYRGCPHACTHCFARPSHVWLDLDADRDFDRVVVVKVNAVERLRVEPRRPGWTGEHVALGTNTDPYQRCEGRYRLTRGVVTTLAEAGIPSGVMLAPVIPGLSDAPAQLRRVVAAAIDAGATHLTPIVLHLRSGVREVFLARERRACIASIVRHMIEYCGGSPDLLPRRFSPQPARAAPGSPSEAPVASPTVDQLTLL